MSPENTFMRAVRFSFFVKFFAHSMQEIAPPNVVFILSLFKSLFLEKEISHLSYEPDEDEDEEFVQLVKIDPEDLKSLRRT